MFEVKKIIDPNLTIRVENVNQYYPNQIVRFCSKTVSTGGSHNEIRINEDPNGNISAYFLPWKEEEGLYIDIPCNNPTAKAFLTPHLNGCLIGIKEITIDGVVTYIRICHWNSTDILMLDLSRYTNWILPQGMEKNANDKNIVYYFSPPSCFYGEYYGGKWNFTLWQARQDR